MMNTAVSNRVSQLLRMAAPQLLDCVGPGVGTKWYGEGSFWATWRSYVSTRSPCTAAAKIALPNPNERCFRSTFGHYRGRNRIFAYRALANGIFTQGVFADWRSHWLRLRPWEVGSNCCSHEGQRSQADDHKLQHQILPHCESRSLESYKGKFDATMATMNGIEELAVHKAVFCRMLRKWHEIRGAGRRF